MKSYTLELNIKESERRSALADHVSIKYSLLCDELGVEPEDRLLYEHGKAEMELRRRAAVRELSRPPNGEKYRRFLDEVNLLAINLRDYQSQWEDKASLLIKYFPGRFDDRAKKPIRSYSPSDIGKIFMKLFGYSKGITQRASSI